MKKDRILPAPTNHTIFYLFVSHDSLKCFLTGRKDLVIQYRKDDLDIIIRITLNKVIACLDSFSPSFIHRLSEYSCGYQRKAYGMQTILFCKQKRLLICTVQKFRFTMLSTGPARSNCMDYIFCRELKSRSDNS